MHEAGFELGLIDVKPADLVPLHRYKADSTSELDAPEFLSQCGAGRGVLNQNDMGPVFLCQSDRGRL
jgi:hypothetical protein